ncbi:MAG: hypothetical protein OET79_07680, partial [Nitrospirota bacterium]|nr:hypothetical protein [Nitrospirota bacterium]
RGTEVVGEIRTGPRDAGADASTRIGGDLAEVSNRHAVSGTPDSSLLRAARRSGRKPHPPPLRLCPFLSWRC